jgi:hypothetical protein
VSGTTGEDGPVGTGDTARRSASAATDTVMSPQDTARDVFRNRGRIPGPPKRDGGA